MQDGFTHVHHVQSPDLEVLLTRQGGNLIHTHGVGIIQPLVQSMHHKPGKSVDLVLFRQEEQSREHRRPVLQWGGEREGVEILHERDADRERFGESQVGRLESGRVECAEQRIVDVNRNVRDDTGGFGLELPFLRGEPRPSLEEQSFRALDSSAVVAHHFEVRSEVLVQHRQSRFLQLGRHFQLRWGIDPERLERDDGHVIDTDCSSSVVGGQVGVLVPENKEFGLVGPDDGSVPAARGEDTRLEVSPSERLEVERIHRESGRSRGEVKATEYEVVADDSAGGETETRRLSCAGHAG